MGEAKIFLKYILTQYFALIPRSTDFFRIINLAYSILRDLEFMIKFINSPIEKNE